MDMERETERLAADTLNEVRPVVARLLPGADVVNDATGWADATVTVGHAADVTVGAGAAHAVARALRGGRDLDRTRPSDWHVRSYGPLLDDRGTEAGGERRRVGTTFHLSRSYAVPEGFDETVDDDEAFPATGTRT